MSLPLLLALLVLACISAPARAQEAGKGTDSTEQAKGEQEDPCGGTALPKPWYCCDPGDDSCEVESKALEHREHPDPVVGITVGYGARVGPTPDPRLADSLPLAHFLAALAIDAVPALRGSSLAVGFDLEYMLEGESTERLYGGRVSTAITLHSFSLGTVLRYMLDEGDPPLFALILRPALGVTFGELALRDGASGADHVSRDELPFVRVGGGIMWRTAGLTLEGGGLITLDELTLEQDSSPERITLELQSLYVRLTLTIRIP